MRGIFSSVRLRTAFGALFFVAMALPAAATEKRNKSAADRHRLAETLVEEALHREIYGAEQQRSELLSAALSEVEDYEPARWHQGFVREHKRWVKFDALPQMKSDYRLLTTYRARRAEASDTVAGQLKLAKWCKTRGLSDQARAHLTRVLAIEPEHLEARRLLGHRRVGESWVTPREVAASVAQAAERKEAVARWAPKLRKLIVRLESPSKRSREAAIAELRAIDDPAAVPVIEAMLSQRSEQTASYAVDSLAKMSAPAAAVSLAPHAVFSQWESVRSDAARRLKEKPMEHYVPVMLGAMRSPAQARRELFQSSNGQLNYRFAVFREGRERSEVDVFESTYVRVPQAGGDANETLDRAVRDAAEQNVARQQAVIAENMATVQRNMRIARALSSSTGQNHSGDPSEWWTWWDDYNEVFVSTEKPTSIRFDREVVRVEDTPTDLSINIRDRGRRSDRESESKDCLAAGTGVWTETGLVAIEKIRVGDRVLSQHPDTGELCYKPVLRTTIRPSSRLTRIQLTDGEAISTSGGHLFWCSGEGWVRSRDVRSGMLLHTVAGTEAVSFVQKTGEERTYNLIVADFNTYFVGKARVLSHDNTVSRPTDNLVPGHAGN